MLARQLRILAAEWRRCIVAAMKQAHAVAVPFTAAALTALALAAPARADADSDFLAMLAGYGFSPPPDGGKAVIQLAHNICNDLHGGASVAAETKLLDRIAPPPMTIEQAGNLVTASQSAYCPDTQGQ
jgi:hypothetical protein